MNEIHKGKKDGLSKQQNNIMKKKHQTNALDKRLFNFAVNIIRFLTHQFYSPEMRVIRTQLTRSATSAGANYEEAQAGYSRLDFINKTSIALKEMRESNYWLRLILSSFKLNSGQRKDLLTLISESEELKKILGAIVVKSRKNKSAEK